MKNKLTFFRVRACCVCEVTLGGGAGVKPAYIFKGAEERRPAIAHIRARIPPGDICLISHSVLESATPHYVTYVHGIF